MESATKLNSMQLYMLHAFNRPISKKQESEIKQLLVDYFAKKVDDEVDLIWNKRNMKQKDLDAKLKVYKRTKYSV